ncbi:Hypothetical predicted protein [Olea europaea subsp. europaea]|uniref:Vacuolar protein sorting-associated protein 51 homolog n=1 Tax=Olea europaea subsp. europaea TaxID=158383 RepID=A0A8S0QUD5_OLEEU|nr:Hypothetical predicted protein [Olea europaea subsp. europaea]
MFYAKFQEIASSFSGGDVRSCEYGPAFVPAEICCTFRADGEMYLHLYIKMRTQRIVVILKKRFTAPNWVKFLKSTLKDITEDEAAIDFLLDEVIDATTERCLDSVPLEPLILDRLVKAKLAKTLQHSPASEENTLNF